MNLFKITCLIFITTFMFSCSKKTNDVAATKNTTSMGESRESAQADGEGEARRRGQGRRGGDPAQRQKRQELLYAELNLSEAQVEKAKEIDDKYITKMQALRENRTGDREAMRASMQTMREQQNEEYKNIMTEEQYSKYMKILEEQRGKRGQRGQRRGGGK